MPCGAVPATLLHTLPQLHRSCTRLQTRHSINAEKWSAVLVQAFRLYGTIIFIVYTVVSTIILGNLLIAIITNSYRCVQQQVKETACDLAHDLRTISIKCLAVFALS